MVQKTFTDSTEKLCPQCGETKPTTEFGKSSYTLHGFSVYCKKCTYERHNEWRLANKDKCAEQSRRWRKSHPRDAKDHSLRSRYGVPLGWYDDLLAKQEGKCACCGSADPGGRGDFHLDHCHETNAIRGLVCHHCNVGLGNFKHDVSLLENAIRYLNRR